ncbi:MAG: sulfite exporter TauE/SafE family protein [Methylococcales bacterium]|nr:sulfite exporter TauE/SafE family protein [Methylococcales bacterium]MDD5214424.1 sulfite exporter TauE/SafE family protein [Methylococcales bacterium]
MIFAPEFTSSLSVALLMGLFSSLHCIGMCGSIIGSLTFSLAPEIRNDKKRLLPFILSYNAGRITSYGIAGALAGLLEVLVTMPLGETHGHRILQIISALIMTGAGLYIAGWFPRFAYIEKLGLHVWRRVEPFGRKLIPVKNCKNAYLFGMVWGWIPCGLVYAALALTVTTGNVLQSSLTMVAFGLGTLPAVLGVGAMIGILTRLAANQRFKQIVGIIMIALALLAAFPTLNPMAMTNPHAMTHE